ncbi:MAG: sigma-54-dependent Fis family transcriptional regulator [Candidatus Schekmanbacteria bacterium]|nr:MAG: sigma-54-dependent Fis family transcriptional regulator [Candidatus Schekmanbacteria bacterium]
MTDKQKILVVDDDLEMAEVLKDFLTEEGFAVFVANRGSDALKLAEEENFALAITDMKMPQMSGMQLLKKIKNIDPNIEVIMITAFGSIETAIEAVKQGAYHYITKPFKMNEILLTIRKALEKRNLQIENLELRNEIERKYSFFNIIGKSPAMQKVFEMIKVVSQNNSNVVIYGASGTGKELVAKAIHYNGKRKNRPFVPINCTAIPEGLLESELFGHAKGAFTGAVGSKQGLFEKANKGTLFLDEIGDMGLGLQAKLLRVLQDKVIRPVGSLQTINVDVRIIAATNKNLEEEVEKQRFREDLYYRLNVIPIHIPPLNERREDIPLLINHFLKKIEEEQGIKKEISDEAVRVLTTHDWKGNVRELENAIERAVMLSRKNILEPDDFQISESSSGFNFSYFLKQKLPLEDFEKKYIDAVLKEVGGNKQKAAEILGISSRTLYRKEKRYNISNKDKE